MTREREMAWVGALAGAGLGLGLLAQIMCWLPWGSLIVLAAIVLAATAQVAKGVA